MSKGLIRSLLFACCTVGVVLSGLSLHNHYSAAPTDYCDLSTMFNCDLVNRSVYSRLFGVPVALVGLLGYVFLIGLSVRSGRLLASFRFLTALAGLGFALYLAYIEAYVIGVWCLLCIGSLIMISAITALAGIALRQTWKIEPAIYGSQ
jgi:vitamin-K-epoxide reductase (warfarin-sensitive)